MTIIPLSKQGARFISVGLYCTSEREDLDLKMPGLWPKYTKIYKWKANARNRRSGNRMKHNTHQNQQDHRNTSAGSQAQDQGDRNNRNSTGLRPDQLLMQQQWRSQSR